jgi:hypothetical protein
LPLDRLQQGGLGSDLGPNPGPDCYFAQLQDGEHASAHVQTGAHAHSGAHPHFAVVESVAFPAEHAQVQAVGLSSEVMAFSVH